MAPALILLGVCVFAWGLRYKLSFYARPHSISHKMAEAKLLLTDRSTLPAVALHTSSPRVTPLALSLWVPALFLIAGFNLRFGREWALDRGRVRTLSAWFSTAPVSIRPPPRG